MHRLSRFLKNKGDKDFWKWKSLYLKKAVSDFLLYLKRCLGFLDFGKMGAASIFEINILNLKKGSGDFLWYLKRCSDFLQLGKRGAIRILEMDVLQLK